MLHNRQAQQVLQQARQSITEYDFARARQHLEAYLNLRPQDAQGHFLLAQVCRRQLPEDFPSAHQHLEEARRLGFPRRETSLEGLMLDYQEKEDPRALESLTSFAASGHPEDPRIFESLVRGSIRSGQINRAAAWLEDWLRRHPHDGYARLWRGAVREFLGQPNLAVGDFQWVLENGPAFPAIRLHLGLMRIQSGYGYPAALRQLESFRQDHPDNTDALVGIAECRRALGDFAAARTLLDEVIAQQPDNEGALLGLALIAQETGDEEQALKQLRRLEPLVRQSHAQQNRQRLLRLEPIASNREVPHRLAIVSHLLAGSLRRTGHPQEAEDCTRRVEQIRADRIELRQVQKELKDRPSDAALMYRCGILSLRVGLDEEGQDWLRRLLKEHPDDRQARQALSAYLHNHKEPDYPSSARSHRIMTNDRP